MTAKHGLRTTLVSSFDKENNYDLLYVSKLHKYSFCVPLHSNNNIVYFSKNLVTECFGSNINQSGHQITGKIHKSDIFQIL